MELAKITIAKIELHLSPMKLAASIKRRIKAASGEYSHCRGHTDKRFVTMPYSPDSVVLANELIHSYGGPGTPVLLRSAGHDGSMPAWVEVNFCKKTDADPMAKVKALFDANLDNAVKRGIVKPREIFTADELLAKRLAYLRLQEAGCVKELASIRKKIRQLTSDKDE